MIDQRPGMDETTRSKRLRKEIKWFLRFYLVGALVVCIYSLNLVAMSWRSLDWAVAYGQILFSRLVFNDSSDRSQEAQLEILYTYTVKGREFHGDRVFFGGAYPASQYLKKYPAGKRIEVRYDPDDPTSSVLEPGIHRQPIIIMMFGLFLLTLGFATLSRFYHGGLVFLFQEEWNSLLDEWRFAVERGDEGEAEILSRKIRDGNRLDSTARILLLSALFIAIALIGCAFWPQYQPWLVKQGLLKPQQPSSPFQSRPGTEAESRKSAPDYVKKEAEKVASKGPATVPEGEKIKVSIVGHFVPTEEAVLGAWQGAISLSDEPLNTVVREPVYSGGIHLYGSLRLGTRENRTYNFIVDMADPLDPRVYIDKNQNGDFTDDGEPLVTHKQGMLTVELKLPMHRLIKELDTTHDFRIRLFADEKALRQHRAAYYSSTKLKGNVIIDGKPFLAYIAEHGMHDADFTNDGIYLDANSNGKIEKSSEYVKPGKAIHVDGKTYHFDITW